MAHFAKLDNNNNVLELIVVSNEEILDENGNESEALGIEFCKNLFGQDTTWIQTSYNNNFRGSLAEPHGGVYDPVNDVFIKRQPHPSWVMTADYDWEAPVAYPEDGNFYDWNEDTQTWDLVETNEAMVPLSVL